MTNSIINKAAKVQDLTGKISETQNTLGKIKPSLFNLIIYSDEEWRTEYFKSLVETILVNVPCRIFFIQSSPNSSYEVIEESFKKDDNATSCDFFTIKCDASSLPRVPSVVMTLLLADLPIYLIWGENPQREKQLLPHFQQYADRIIVVSDCCKGIQAFSKDLLAYSEKTNSEMIDINWAMLGGWRDIMAQLFDSESQLEALRSTKHLEIAFNSRTDNLKFSYTRAAFLQAWIASQMHWEFKHYENKDGVHTITYKNGQNDDLQVVLRPQFQDTLFPGAILDVVFESCVQGEVIKIQRKENLPKVNVMRSDEEKCDLPFSLSLPQVRRPINFIREIFFQNPSKQYHQMLHKIAEVPWT